MVPDQMQKSRLIFIYFIFNFQKTTIITQGSLCKLSFCTFGFLLQKISVKSCLAFVVYALTISLLADANVITQRNAINILFDCFYPILLSYTLNCRSKKICSVFICIEYFLFISSNEVYQKSIKYHYL